MNKQHRNRETTLEVKSELNINGVTEETVEFALLTLMPCQGIQIFRPGNLEMSQYKSEEQLLQKGYKGPGESDMGTLKALSGIFSDSESAKDRMLKADPNLGV